MSASAGLRKRKLLLSRSLTLIFVGNNSLHKHASSSTQHCYYNLPNYLDAMMQRRILVAVFRPEGEALLSKRRFTVPRKLPHPLHGRALRGCLSWSKESPRTMIQAPRRCFSASDKSSPPSTQQQSIFIRAWQAYSQSLSRRPLTTKATAGAIIFFTSDSAAQYITRDRDSDFSYNINRALSGSFFGIVATGYLHVWWGFLEGAVGARVPVARHRLANTMVKVFIDQAFGAPFYIYSYYIVTNFLQTMSENTGHAKNPEQVLKETNAKASAMLWPTMLRHWRLWPLVHSFNFYFVPLHHRVLVQNLVLVGWSGCKYFVSIALGEGLLL